MRPARVAAQFAPAPGTGPGLAETVEAIDSARVTTRILYVTAHPDDESAALLTYLARGAHADVALLTLTRGEGGQNDLGPEQAPQLGLIRTQELLAATRGYGIKLFFANAPDFGFSKTTEETQKIWGDAVLGEMVRVIRTFRPNIVVNGWGGVHGGHGHHQTSGLWTPRAVALAADPNAFVQQLSKDGLTTWGSATNPVQILDTERGGTSSTASNGYPVPVDEISPLWGKTYREIGLDAFANHRSQGITNFISSPFLRRPLVLVPENGGKFDAASLAVRLEQWAKPAAQVLCGPEKPNFCGVLVVADADRRISAARTAALSLDWKGAAEHLAEAGNILANVSRADWYAGLTADQALDLSRARERVENALTLAAGLEIKAEADRSELVVGETFGVHAESNCRKNDACQLGSLQLSRSNEFNEIKREGDLEKGIQLTVEVTQPASPLSAWDKLLPEPPPLLFAEQEVTVAGYHFKARAPVTHIFANSTRLDRVPLRIVPAYTLAVDPKQAIAILGKPAKTLEVLLRLHSYATQPAKLMVGVDVPPGFSGAAPVEISFDGPGDRYAKLSVTTPKDPAPGNHAIVAYARRGNERFSTSLDPLPSLPTQLWSEPAQCVVRALAIAIPKHLRVGYVTAEGEPIPDALRMLGMQVDTLDAQALAFGDLSKFNAIVVGVRAYELRPELPGANQRLLDYVSNGGTVLVQYNRDFAWNRAQYAPYPAKIDNAQAGARVTDENSPVKLLKPDDPLLNRPNKITQDDFKGWVQERGLYFWTQFDSKYTALLAMHDPGEPDLNGALVYARYGKGTYIYTGIAFFRQLPEGVSGAYRLFVNLLSASATR
jgi:LmbE family N-acetylglucosaminyl deacetylase